MNWKKMMAVGLAAVSMMAFVTGCGGDTKKANTELPKMIVSLQWASKMKKAKS